MRRVSYQRGSLRTIRRKDGSTVWEYRWRETQIDGTRRRRVTIVGTLEDYPNESLAQTAVDALRLTINHQTPQALVKNISVDMIDEEMLASRGYARMTGASMGKRTGKETSSGSGETALPNPMSICIGIRAPANSA
jgi:hypothetical protein